VWGLIQSPFILEGTLDSHFENYSDKYSDVIKQVKDDMYVDDLVTGGDNLEQLSELKDKVIILFKKGGFTLHKWHSSEPKLETISCDNNDLNFAKQQLGTKANECKILGLAWNKTKDVYSIEIPEFNEKLTKRNILQGLASVYDPMGFISPVMLKGKIVYRNLCDSKIPWDTVIPPETQRIWTAWVHGLNSRIEIPRAIPTEKEKINFLDIHIFSDASISGVCAVAYAIVHQDNNISQGIIASKSRLAKKNTTIPRLELVGAHMSSNLVDNIKTSLSNYPIRNIVAWTDSTVVLHWLKDNGDYNVFVSN